MKNNKIIIIVIIVIAIALFGNQFGLFASVSFIEDQLRTEYTTYWDDSTDESKADFGECRAFDTCQTAFWTDLNNYLDATPIPVCAKAENPSGNRNCDIVNYPEIYRGNLIDVIHSGNAGFSTTNSIELISSGGSVTLTINERFKGQEVVFVVSGEGGDIVTAGPSGTTSITKLIPHTFEPSIYDVVKDGLKISEIDVGDNGLDISFSTGSSLEVHYIGYKAQFECDLSGDEVWIQEQFTSQFDINDLEFSPTKFCHSTRPFVLRDLTQGERVISRQEGLEPLNRGETIPPLPLGQDEIVVVNYATYYVDGVLNPCGPNEANVKVGNDWVCQSIIDPVTITVQCQQDSDCPMPCVGKSSSCNTNTNLCEFEGTCLTSPTQQTSIWDLISGVFNNLFDFIKSLFS